MCKLNVALRKTDSLSLNNLAEGPSARPQMRLMDGAESAPIAAKGEAG
jgi:hypothetical protein